MSSKAIILSILLQLNAVFLYSQVSAPNQSAQSYGLALAAEHFPDYTFALDSGIYVITHTKNSKSIRIQGTPKQRDDLVRMIVLKRKAPTKAERENFLILCVMLSKELILDKAEVEK